MLRPGLVSITFRQLPAGRVIDLAAESGLAAIEWGGDIHVPHGDLTTARTVGRATCATGLEVSAYGSYYRAGVSESQGLAFADVLSTADALGARVVRVWAGAIDAQNARDEDWREPILDLNRICGMAHRDGIDIAMEFHAGTLNSTSAACRRLMNDVQADNLFTFWQPTHGADDARCLATLRELAPFVLHAHVFNWSTGRADQTPLAEGAARWQPVLELLGELDGDRFASLEFVRGDDPDQFRRDAATLRSWLGPRYSAND